MRDIQMTKGDSASWIVPVTRFDPETGLDVEVDLTGGKAWFTAKRTSHDDDADAIIKKDSTANPTQVTILAPATAGRVQITLLSSDTNTYDGKWLQYDVQVREADGTINTVVKGRLELGKQTTQAVV